MKKLLLTILSCAMVCISAVADEYTITPDMTKSTISDDGKILTCPWTDASGVVFTCTIDRNNQSTALTGVTGQNNELRWYAGMIMSITGPEGSVINKITFVLNSSNKAKTFTSNCGGTVTDAANTNKDSRIVWQDEAGVDVFKATATSQVRTYKIIIDATVESDPTAVAAPKFELVEGDSSYSVIITAEEGAEIYYTTDGSEPTEESAKYTAPVEVWENTLFKAIAVVDGKASRVASYSCEPPMLLEDFSALGGLDAADVPAAGINIVVKGTATVVVQTGNYIYLKAGYSYGLLFGYNLGTYSAGDTFTRIEGIFKFYNGLPEITSPAMVAGEKGAPVLPEEVDFDQLGANYINHYVVFSGVDIADGSISQDEKTMTIYNRFGITVDDGENLTVTGFVGIYGTTLQFYPTDIKSADGKEKVAAPEFSIASGAYEEGTAVSLSCATEGAAIYYTLDGTEPTAESTLYTEPIILAQDVTIKAIAVAEGYDDSAVSTAAYTIKEPVVIVGTQACFDFTDTTSFTIEPAADFAASAKVTGSKITVNGVELTFSKGTNTSNDPMLFVSTASDTKGATNLRIYTGNTMTVVCPAEYYITEIEFAATDSNFAMTASTGSLDGELWSATAADAVSRAGEDYYSSTVTFTPTAKTFIDSMKVTFDKIPTAINAPGTENCADVRYFNLQGAPVQNPSAGIFIRVAGGKATKVLMK